MEITITIFLVLSSLGFYNSNAFKFFLKYKLKFWNFYFSLFKFEKILQNVQYLVKNGLYNVGHNYHSFLYGYGFFSPSGFGRHVQNFGSPYIIGS